MRDKRVLLRVDYNITAEEDGSLSDDWRIRATIPTIQRLQKDGARIGILTHRGRPQGRIMPELSTEPLARRLEELLGQKVEFVPDCVGRIAEQAMAELAPGKVLMFENTRFYLGDQLNQMGFINKLCRLGDIFVNDAFACAHRAHASTSGLAAAMPISVIGDLMVHELKWVRRVMDNPERPFLLMVGGADVGPRLELVSHVLTKVDTLVLGGTVGMTFLAGRDVNLGQSQIEHSCIDACRELLSEAGVVGCRLHLPRDVVVAQKNNLSTAIGTKDLHDMAEDEVASDVGAETLKIWKRLIQEAKTVVWLGRLGNVDHAAFRHGTVEIGKTLAQKSEFSLVGGSGLIKTLNQDGLRERLPAVSTGVGALLAGLMGQSLPPLAVLQIRKSDGWKNVDRRGTNEHFLEEGF